MIPFTLINWTDIDAINQPGDSGYSISRTMNLENICIRMVEYSENYKADHWCSKGHIVHCLEGIFLLEFENNDSVLLSTGMTFIVSDDLTSHRSVSKNGAKLLIIDGSFLKNNS